MEKVKKIIKDVEKNGDKAVKKYTEIFDKQKLSRLEVTKKEIKEAYKKVDKETLKALKKALSNIKRFAKEQKKQYKDFKYEKDGVTLGQKVVPLERVGVYVPGGNYPLPSTALMCITPAKVAGVKEIIVCSPKIVPTTIVAADFAGADKIYRIGGVQAIAALAKGTRAIPKVDKIVGPGNAYVTAAKKEIFGKTGIDLLAGPSEVLIITDNNADAKFVAADLLAQAEHDVEAKIVLVSSSKQKIKEIEKEIKDQLKELSTKDIIKESLKNKEVIKVKSIKEAIEVANKKAPEHLEVQVKNPEKYLKDFKNYGSLFLGGYSGVVFGDYCSGTNHVLPTEGAARYTGGLSVKDFLKVLTYQKLTKKGAKSLNKTVIKMASVEGLEAHRRSAEIREE